MATAAKQVICISWGTKYRAPYINRLYGMVARNLTPPFGFTCFTDDATGIRPEVRCLPLPPLAGPRPKSRGQWPKARLWSDPLGDLIGPVLFLDLDMVITGSLDDFFSFGDPGAVIMARNDNTPLERLGQTSIYRFPVGHLAPLKAIYEADPQGTADAYEWEQRFVTRNAPGGISFWPRPWVRTYRIHCIWPPPLNYLLPPRLPADCRALIFSGKLNPPDAIAGRWSAAHEALGPAAHLGRLLAGPRPEGRMAFLRHYIRPAPWVSDHWRA
jgi:hypothetical protein